MVLRLSLVSSTTVHGPSCVPSNAGLHAAQTPIISHGPPIPHSSILYWNFVRPPVPETGRGRAAGPASLKVREILRARFLERSDPSHAPFLVWDFGRGQSPPPARRISCAPRPAPGFWWRHMRGPDPARPPFAFEHLSDPILFMRAHIAAGHSSGPRQRHVRLRHSLRVTRQH